MGVVLMRMSKEGILEKPTHLLQITNLINFLNIFKLFI